MTSARPLTTSHAIGVPDTGRDLWVPYELLAHTRGTVSERYLLGVDPALAAAPPSAPTHPAAVVGAHQATNAQPCTDSPRIFLTLVHSGTDVKNDR